jgi:hypothetical protein
MEKTSPNAYEYEPLPPGHLRLLKLTRLAPKGDADTSPIWSILTVPVLATNGPRIPYEALSYIWGSLSTTYPLTLDNGQVLQVHHNLHEALPYLAKRPFNLPLWIDAVCINQQDQAEKFAQIRIMSDVYQQATRVLVWLGSGGDQNLVRLVVEKVLPTMVKNAQILKSLPASRSMSPGKFGWPDVDAP